MDGEQKFTLHESHLHFAKTLNARVWELLQKPERTAHEDEMMVHAAHASCVHWTVVGTGLQRQRAEWLIARVYTVLGYAEPALRHAARCLELTHEHAGLMEDFDWAYAYEGLARANALAGRKEIARQYLALATESGQKIQNDEDRGIFLSDFESGEWFGARA